MQKKIQKKCFVFEINTSELSVLTREYLSSTVNMLTKSLETSHVADDVLPSVDPKKEAVVSFFLLFSL